MFTEELPEHFVYTPQVIDYITVAAETCLYLEHTNELTKQDFVFKSIKLLPLLYLKANLLEIPEQVFEEMPERFVSEEDYLFVREQIEQLLGKDDTYLEVFHPDMAFSDEPIIAFISENLADIYQELKDLIATYQLANEDIMNDGVRYSLEMFAEHWGRKLLNALRALHAIRYSNDFELDDMETNQPNTVDRNKFLHFLNDESGIEEF